MKSLQNPSISDAVSRAKTAILNPLIPLTSTCMYAVHLLMLSTQVTQHL
jgi:hypothetical protein